MKFFHLSDLHIGLKLMNKDLKEDMQYVFNQIIEAARREKPQAILIAGDIYDKAIPSADAVEAFDGFISSLAEAVSGGAVMIISGNHDSAQRLNCFRSILLHRNVYMVGLPPQSKDEYIQRAVIKDEYGSVNFYLLPFVKPSMVRRIPLFGTKSGELSYNDAVKGLIERENIDLSERNVLVSHQFYLPKGERAEDIQRADSEIRTVGNIDEVDADILKIFDYAALGHIHKPMKAGGEEYRYSGTPIACSVSESGQKKSILCVELAAKGEPVRVKPIELIPKREIKVIKGLLDEVLKQGCDDYVSAVITDKEDLNFVDMQERLHIAFPNLLNIIRENGRSADYSREINAQRAIDPFDMCCSFLKDMTEDEKNILKDVINTVKGAR